MIVTLKDLNNAKTRNGGYSKAQIALAKTLFPDRWRQSMLCNNVTDDFWSRFVRLSKSSKNESIEAARTKNKILNPISQGDGWSWKPKESDIPTPKFAKGKKNKHKKKVISRKNNEDFYKSEEWLELRVRVLEKYECKCMMCGRSPKLHGVIIHVDHIKPRSKFPDLSLEITNLQLLCAACNKGKGNKYDTDWRPDSIEEMALVIAANERL